MKIATDIRHAHTLPGSFYRDNSMFEKVKEQVFAKSCSMLPMPMW